MALKDKYFTISEAAEEFGVTRQTISRWVKQGELPAERIGREMLIEKNKSFRFFFNRMSGNLMNVIRMAGELCARIELDYAKTDKFNLYHISRSGVFQYWVNRKDGSRDNVSVSITFKINKKGKPTATFNSRKISEKNERKAE